MNLLQVQTVWKCQCQKIVIWNVSIVIMTVICSSSPAQCWPAYHHAAAVTDGDPLSVIRHVEMLETRVIARGNVSLLSWCLVLLLLPQSEAVINMGNPDAKRLYDDLLSNYNKLVRPVQNTTDPLTVRIKLKLSQLIDVVSRTHFLYLLGNFTSQTGPSLSTNYRVVFENYRVFEMVFVHWKLNFLLVNNVWMWQLKSEKDNQTCQQMIIIFVCSILTSASIMK